MKALAHKYNIVLVIGKTSVDPYVYNVALECNRHSICGGILNSAYVVLFFSCVDRALTAFIYDFFSILSLLCVFVCA